MTIKSGTRDSEVQDDEDVDVLRSPDNDYVVTSEIIEKMEIVSFLGIKFEMNSCQKMLNR